MQKERYQSQINQNFDFYLLSKGLQKLGIMFEDICFKNWSHLKNAAKKECSPKQIFFHQKDCRKIQNTFDNESWLWKSDLDCLLWLVWKLVKVKSKFLQNVKVPIFWEGHKIWKKSST